MDSMPTVFTTIWAAAVAAGCNAGALMVIACVLLIAMFATYEFKKRTTS